jgi:sensor histidine kinase YesM
MLMLKFKIGFANKSSVYLLVILVFFSNCCIAQIDTVFFDSDPTVVTEIRNSIGIYEEQGTEKEIEDILLKADLRKDDPLKANEYPHKNLWLKFIIKNRNKDDTLKGSVYFGKQRIRAYYSRLGQNSAVRNELMFTQIVCRFSTKDFHIPIIIPPKSFNTYWVRIENYIYFDNYESYFFPANKGQVFDNGYDFLRTKHFGFICMILGLFFFTGLIASFQSILLKDRTYIFWAMYLFVNALFFAAELNRAFAFGFFDIFIFNKRYHAPLPWPTAIQYLVSVVYLMFISSFLEIKQQNPKIYKFISIAIKIMLLGFVLALVAVIGYDYNFTIYADMFLVVTNLLILATVILIVRSNIPQKNLLMIGSTGVLISASISIFVEILEKQNELGFWLIPIITYSVGCLWELSCFALALSQRTKRMQYEAQQIQKNYTAKLENELSERLEVIHIKDKQLEEQRINTLTSEFEQKIAETEITALRSQMNPHFIFNCLNSIKLYSLENDTESASNYLTKFSKLIRLVLDNSRSERLTLEKEIETLRLYIEMEIMRFKDKVQYELIVSPEIDQQYVEIPPLLIQPFVENAIWHGLMHKEFGGKVSIFVNLISENMLEIQIIDNGVGREKSAEYKSKTATKHKSFGMKVTNERIDLINQIYKTNAKIDIVDLYDEQNVGVGTKVIIQIPI